MGERTALLSVRPRFADALLNGTKTVEIRRRGARLDSGAICLLYASSPVRALVGAIEVDSVHVAPAAELWNQWGPQTALDRAEFDDYLIGSQSPCANAVRSVMRFESPILLAELRRRHHAFVVPQSYRFIGPDELPNLTNGQTVQLARFIRPATIGRQMRLAT